ncbi:MAG: hypothetical protein QW575_06265 [Thermoproteota archaeon]
MKEKKKMISLYIPLQLYEKLLRNKQKKGISATFQIVEALEKYLKSE